MDFASSYDPSEDEDDTDRPAPKKKPAKKSNGPKRSRTWVEVDEYGEPEPLDAKKLEKLRQRAQNLCLWHLGQRPCTRKQLLDAMTKKGVPVEMAESILEKLAEYNYVNDQQYADAFVSSKHNSQRKAASAIRYELIRKGVAAETIDEALEQVTDESELENAQTLVARKLYSTRRLDRQKRTNRLVGMLSRKGYPPSIAFRVVKEALDAEVSDADETDDTDDTVYADLD